ncbi:MAG TPA: hypothetical protein VKY19_11075 [Ktedonosporobacter sp.]|nr:hypothetical protein [Ktedonosporobacter sp.]
MSSFHSPFRGTPISPIGFCGNGSLQELFVGPLLLPGRLKEGR